MRRNTTTIFALAVLVALTGCGDDDATGGPIDGTWRVDTFSCNGVAQTIPVLTVSIADTSGTFVIEIPTVCTSTITETYSYPTDGSILITPTANDCVPDGAACAPAFGGVDVCPSPPPTEFAFALSGDALTFTRTSEGPPVDTCPAGETVEYQMTRM